MVVWYNMAHQASQFMLGLYNSSVIDFIVVKSNSRGGIDAVNSFALLYDRTQRGGHSAS